MSSNPLESPHYDFPSSALGAMPHRGGGSTARLGGRELTLLCGFNHYTLETIVDSLRHPFVLLPKVGGAMPPTLGNNTKGCLMITS